MTRTFSAVTAAILLIIAASGSASAQVPTTGWGGPPPARIGTHFVVWHGGPLDEAADVQNLVSLWVMFDGKFEGYSPDSPEFVNRAFRARFPSGILPPNTPVLVVIGPPTPGATSDVSRVEFGETCVWCATSASLAIAPEGESVRIHSVQVSGSASDQFRIEKSCAGLIRAACELRVAFHPTHPDRTDARLEVRHSGSNSPLVVALSGFGTCDRPSAQHVQLLDAAVGYGGDATGGAAGCLVRVTSLAGRGAGTLREAAERPGPAWIVFEVSGTVRLDKYIYIARDKTIDGRGASIAIEGAGLAMVNTPNVVVTNLRIHDVSDDGLHIRGQATSDVWVSHVTIWNAADGYIDITQGATNITIAWSRFQRSPNRPQEKTILVGAHDPGDKDERTRVTLHNNLFEGTNQRSPLLRSGRVHSFNNLFDGWGIYGSGVSRGGQLLSERNLYAHKGGDHPARAFTPWDEAAHNGGATAFIRSSGDRFLNGASGVEANPSSVRAPEYAYRADEASDSLLQTLRNQAGARTTQ